jgi:SAM-dependent methyltransferase
MKPHLRTAAVALALAALACVPLAHAQSKPETGNEFQPQVGQAGKDVIWVPTPEPLVERMLTMAQTTPRDLVVDLGSGDGRTVITAAKRFGARAQGIEYNPDMVALAQKNAVREGVQARTEFARGDIFETDFSQATVVTMYLLPNLNAKLRPKILAMRPGTRVVSHQFDMEDWEPDEVSNYEGRRAMLWIVPAKVQGGWKLRYALGGDARAHDLTFEQKYQQLKGTVRLKDLSAGLREPRLRGDEIRFSFVDGIGQRRDFTGRASGSAMEGTVRSENGAETRWTATRY